MEDYLLKVFASRPRREHAASLRFLGVSDMSFAPGPGMDREKDSETIVQKLCCHLHEVLFVPCNHDNVACKLMCQWKERYVSLGNSDQKSSLLCEIVAKKFLSKTSVKFFSLKKLQNSKNFPPSHVFFHSFSRDSVCPLCQSIDWLIDGWMNNGLIDWLIVRLFDRLIDWLIDCSIDWLMIVWLIDRLIDWLFCFKTRNVFFLLRLIGGWWFKRPGTFTGTSGPAGSPAFSFSTSIWSSNTSAHGRPRCSSSTPWKTSSSIFLIDWPWTFGIRKWPMRLSTWRWTGRNGSATAPLLPNATASRPSSSSTEPTLWRRWRTRWNRRGRRFTLEGGGCRRMSSSNGPSRTEFGGGWIKSSNEERFVFLFFSGFDFSVFFSHLKKKFEKFLFFYFLKFFLKFF